MRANVVFPPSICLPNQIYYSLPLLAGALRRGGHEPRAVDMNLACADRLLDDGKVRQFERIALDMIDTARRNGSEEVAAAIRANIDRNLPIIAEGEACKRALRHPERFYHRPTFNHSFWTIVQALGAYYQLDPVISPFREDFAADMIAHQAAEPWSIMTLLYEEGLLDEALVGDPEFVGISVCFPEQAAEAIRLARRIRARDPGIHICFGGTLLNDNPDKWLEQDWLLDYCDSVVIGDGETAIVELCDALEGRRPMDSVRNLVWRDAAGAVHRPQAAPYLENMDDLPVPDFAAIDMTRFFLPEPIYPIMLSRGCYWGRCTFCSLGWRKNYRAASAAKIEADVLEVTRRYGGRFLYPQDSSIPPKSAHRLATVVREHGLEAHWYAGMRFEHNLLDRDYCRHLAEGGCRSLCMGFESSDQRLLDLMDKGIRFEDMPVILDNLREVEISAELLWFVGFPTQTRRDVFETASYLYDRRDKFGLTAFVGSYALHPDSIVFERPQDFGIKLVEERNDRYTYETESGLRVEEVEELKLMLASNDNRTLTCNGSHLPHLAMRERNTVGLGREMNVPAAVAAYCAE